MSGIQEFSNTLQILTEIVDSIDSTDQVAEQMVLAVQTHLVELKIHRLAGRVIGWNTPEKGDAKGTVPFSDTK